MFSLVNPKSNSLAFGKAAYAKAHKMKTILRQLFALSFGIAALTCASVSAQDVKVTAGRPQFDDYPSPKTEGTKSKPFEPGDWTEAELKLNAEMSPEPPSKACDKITVKWYVAVKNPDKAGQILLLTKEVEYVNVPLKKDIYCSVYLSPNSVRRLTGSDRQGKNAVESIGYEIMFNGKKVAEESTKGKPGWWDVPNEKIVRSETVPLLKKSETPFRDLWWDRFAEEAPTKQ